jgi:hypothetical protein
MIYCLIPVCTILFFKYLLLKDEYNNLLTRYYILIKKNDEQTRERE